MGRRLQKGRSRLPALRSALAIVIPPRCMPAPFLHAQKCATSPKDPRSVRRGRGRHFAQVPRIVPATRTLAFQQAPPLGDGAKICQTKRKIGYVLIAGFPYHRGEPFCCRTRVAREQPEISSAGLTL
jgi:hypothetical protein